MSALSKILIVLSSVAAFFAFVNVAMFDAYDQGAWCIGMSIWALMLSERARS